MPFKPVTQLVLSLLVFGVSNQLAAAQVPMSTSMYERDDCPDLFFQKVTPKYGKQLRVPHDRFYYGNLSWYAKGLDETLKDRDAVIGLTETLKKCVDNRLACPQLDEVKFGKSEVRNFERLKQAIFDNDSKDISRYQARLKKKLPEKVSDNFLFAWGEKRSACGFTPEMRAKYDAWVSQENIRKTEAMLASLTPEDRVKHDLCTKALATFERAENERPNSLYNIEFEWAEGFEKNIAENKACETTPPLSLVNDTPMGGDDPYAEMIFDHYEPRRFWRLAEAAPVNASNPGYLDCFAGSVAINHMLQRRLAKARPEEQEWLDSYTASKKASFENPSHPPAVCSPLPTRIASWADELIHHVGWEWPATQLQPIDREDCLYAIYELPQNTVAPDFERWRSTKLVHNSRVYWDKTKGCKEVPRSFATELATAVYDHRTNRELKRVRAEIQAMEDAQNNPRPKTLQELLEEYNNSYRPPVRKEERCYINQYGREHCYVR